MNKEYFYAGNLFSNTRKRWTLFFPCLFFLTLHNMQLNLKLLAKYLCGFSCFSFLLLLRPDHPEHLGWASLRLYFINILGVKISQRQLDGLFLHTYSAEVVNKLGQVTCWIHLDRKYTISFRSMLLLLTAVAEGSLPVERVESALEQFMCWSLPQTTHWEVF